MQSNPSNLKPLHHFSLAEVRRDADKYFPDPVDFRQRASRHYCVDRASGRVWGEGTSYAGAFVDAMAKMEKVKAIAKAKHDQSQASVNRVSPVPIPYVPPPPLMPPPKKSMMEMLRGILA